MVSVDLRHDHGHIGGKAMGTVVGHDRALGLGVRFFQCLDLVLFHVDGAEHEVDLGGNFLYFGGIEHDEFFRTFRHRRFHQPAIPDGFFVRFASAARTRSYGGQMEPGVVFQQRDKALADHTGSTNDTYIVLFHLS